MASQSKILLRTLCVFFLLCLVNYVFIHRLATSITSLVGYEELPPVDVHPSRIQKKLLSTRASKKGDDLQFRQLNVTEFPYKCGVVLFYHIPCTGEFHFVYIDI
jgi:hypothetical protein